MLAPRHASVLSIIIFLLSGQEVFGGETVPRKAVVARAVGAVKLDGKLDEESWRAAPVHTGFTPLGGDNPALIREDAQTFLQIVQDDAAVYFGIRCNDPDAAHLQPFDPPGLWDAPMWKNDAVEIFLGPGGGEENYFQFAIDAAGTQFDEFMPTKMKGGGGYSSSWQAAVSCEANCWSVEVRIPFSALYRLPSAKWLETWTFSLARTRHPAPGEDGLQLSTFTPLSGGFHDVAHFGSLEPLKFAPEAYVLQPNAIRFEKTEKRGLKTWIEVENLGTLPFTGTATLTIPDEGARGAKAEVDILPGKTAAIAFPEAKMGKGMELVPVVISITDAAGREIMLARYDDPITASLACLSRTREAELVNDWYLAGQAAGNDGDFYDNRDRRHSWLDLRQFPQMRLYAYTEEELARRADWAATAAVRPHVTIGNSSTSDAPNRSGSNPRTLYIQNMPQLYDQYRGNNMYVYPEHCDHDRGHNGLGCSAEDPRPNGWGDLYPTNTPYLMISQGSSGRDKPCLMAYAHTLAAFDPKLKKLLAEKGLLMPTLQALFRRAYQKLSPEDYFTGAAHPAAFSGKDVDPVAMVNAAHAMTAATVPPLALLKVVEESEAEPWKDYLEGIRREKLADTPCVIARVHRRLSRDLRMVVSARDSFDLEGKPLAWRWEVLRGDPKRIALKERDNGAACEIVIPWHGRISPESELSSNRVEIGVFAGNGAAWSAPSFITVFYPDQEQRVYADDGRLLAVDYAAEDLTIGYDTTLLVSCESVPVYAVTDWDGLFALLLDQPDSPAAGLLALTPEEMAALQTTRTAFAEAFASFKQFLPEAEKLTERPQRHPALRKAAVKASAPLLAREPEDVRSAKDIIETALNRLADQPSFWRECLRAPTAEEGESKQVAAELERLLKIGLLTRMQEDGTFHLAAGDETEPNYFAKRELRRLALTMMGERLFKGLLKCEVRSNYVDTRLGSPASWVDEFHYDPQGKMSGWTRCYRDRLPEQFTADGFLQERKEGGTATVGVRYATRIEYKDEGKLAGYVLCDRRGASVWDGAGKQIFDAAKEGQGAAPAQVQFLVFALEKDEAGKVLRREIAIDLNLYDQKSGKQTGWLRWRAGHVSEYVLTGEKFATRNPQGEWIEPEEPYAGLESAGFTLVAIPEK